MKKIAEIGAYTGYDPTTTSSRGGKAMKAYNCDFGERDSAFKSRKAGSTNRSAGTLAGMPTLSLMKMSPPGEEYDSLFAIQNSNKLYNLSDKNSSIIYSGQATLFDTEKATWGSNISPGEVIRCSDTSGGDHSSTRTYDTLILNKAKSRELPSYYVKAKNVDTTNAIYCQARLYISDDGMEWRQIDSVNSSISPSSTWNIGLNTSSEKYEPCYFTRINIILKPYIEIESITVTSDTYYEEQTEIKTKSGASYTVYNGDAVSEQFGDFLYFTSWNETYLDKPPTAIVKSGSTYPYSFYFRSMGVPEPEYAPTHTASATAGNPNGTYKYRFAYVNDAGAVGNPSPESTSITVTSKQITVQALTAGPVDSAITKRIIYRTKAGGATYYKLATINDNTTTAYTDDIPDTALTELMETDNYEPPISSIIYLHKNIMFFVDDSNPTKLWFSKVAGYFPDSLNGGLECVPLTYYKIFPDAILGLATLNGDLIVSGKRFTSAVSGDIFGGPLDDTKTRQIADFGTFSHKGMALCIDRNMKNTLIVPTENGLIAVYAGYENSIDVSPFGPELQRDWSRLGYKGKKVTSIFHNSRLYIFLEDSLSTFVAEKYFCIVYDFNKEAFVGKWTERQEMYNAVVCDNQIVIYQNHTGLNKLLRIWDYSPGSSYGSSYYDYVGHIAFVDYVIPFDNMHTVAFWDYEFPAPYYPDAVIIGTGGMYDLERSIIEDFATMINVDGSWIYYRPGWEAEVYWTKFRTPPVSSYNAYRIASSRMRVGRRGRILEVEFYSSDANIDIYRVQFFGEEWEV